MSILSEELERYLGLRRSLGYDLKTDERILRRFITFAEQQGEAHIQTELFLRWQASCASVKRQTWARRYGIVKLFAQWLHSIDPEHQMLPSALIPGSARRSPPYIYSEEDICRIVEAAAVLRSLNGIRALTYAALFGLMSATGLRVGEAVSLDTNDIDIDSGVITLRVGKCGKERLLPLSDSTTAQLAAYTTERNRLLGYGPEPFFVSDRGERLTDCSARYNFAVVCQSIGLRPAQKFYRHGCGPRLHDLRHSFAVRTLINWYRTGKDPDREMIKLSTYLGHTNPASTYWYIEAVPELLELASRRAVDSLAEEAAS